MPISHMTLRTTDMNKLAPYYEKVLATLGYKETYNIHDGAIRGYSDEHGPSFWLMATNAGLKEGQEPKKPSGPVHIGFCAKSHEQVKTFYDAAIAAGGTCNGPPGPRPQYTPTYYGAFVHDPEGHNIEAVYFEERGPSDASAK